jgi:hypothetical protein
MTQITGGIGDWIAVQNCAQITCGDNLLRGQAARKFRLIFLLFGWSNTAKNWGGWSAESKKISQNFYWLIRVNILSEFWQFLADFLTNFWTVGTDLNICECHSTSQHESGPPLSRGLCQEMLGGVHWVDCSYTCVYVVFCMFNLHVWIWWKSPKEILIAPIYGNFIFDRVKKGVAEGHQHG